MVETIHLTRSPILGRIPVSSTESYLENDLEGLQEEVNLYHPLDYEGETE